MPSVLVLGATGKQGRCVAQACLEDFPGLTVWALTRNAEGKGAKALEDKGAKIVQGDFGTKEAFVKVLEEAKPDMLFLMMNEEMGTTTKGEFCAKNLAEAKLVIDTSKAHGVEYVVFTSVCGVQDAAEWGMPCFAAKGDAEELLKGSGMKYTILRPVTLMDSFMDKEMGGLTKTEVVGLTALATTRMWYVSCHDMGKAAAACFNDRDLHAGKAFECASQALTGEEIVAAYKKAIGVESEGGVGWKFLPGATDYPDFVAMDAYWEKKGYPVTDATMAAFKTVVPQPWTIEDYLKSVGDAIPQRDE